MTPEPSAQHTGALKAPTMPIHVSARRIGIPSALTCLPSNKRTSNLEARLALLRLLFQAHRVQLHLVALLDLHLVQRIPAELDHELRVVLAGVVSQARLVL